jgi:dienelactone hydrolase
MLMVPLFALLLAAAPAPAVERITFKTPDPAFHGMLRATLQLPPGPGPFPAIVLLHNSWGIEPFIADYARWFVSLGYAAVVVDSFGPRGTKTPLPPNAEPSIKARAFDAYGALNYLRTRADIDPGRIGLIGWSHGGAGAFIAAGYAMSHDEAADRPFRAVIGIYPSCFAPIRLLSAPLLVLTGADDDWQSPGICSAAVDGMDPAGAPGEIHVYPGATHAFDNPNSRGVMFVYPAYHNHVYNAGAARDAHERIRTFLERAL